MSVTSVHSAGCVTSLILVSPGKVAHLFNPLNVIFDASEKNNLIKNFDKWQNDFNFFLSWQPNCVRHLALCSRSPLQVEQANLMDSLMQNGLCKLCAQEGFDPDQAKEHILVYHNIGRTDWRSDYQGTIAVFAFV